MATYAVMNGDTVENLIVADSLEIAEAVSEKKCIRHTEKFHLKVGDKYNFATNKFIVPKTD